MPESHLLVFSRVFYRFVISCFFTVFVAERYRVVVGVSLFSNALTDLASLESYHERVTSFSTTEQKDQTDLRLK